VSVEVAQLDLAKEWASIPMANGKGFYDGDSAGNRASGSAQEVQKTLENAKKALGGKTLPQLLLPAQQDPKIAAPPPGKELEPSVLQLMRTKVKDPRGLEILSLQRYKNGIPMGAINVVSGVAGAQNFRKGPDSKSGSLEPLPQGVWKIEDIAWAAGKDNYEGSWGAGLGPASIPLTWQGPGKTERGSIEMHFDANAGQSPGTAGCVGLNSIADLQTCISWLRADNPRVLIVDWKL
jgi:hypothetical protein